MELLGKEKSFRVSEKYSGQIAVKWFNNLLRPGAPFGHKKTPADRLPGRPILVKSGRLERVAEITHGVADLFVEHMGINLGRFYVGVAEQVF